MTELIMINVSIIYLALSNLSLVLRSIIHIIAMFKAAVSI